MLRRSIWSSGAVFIAWFCLLNGAGGQITHPAEVAALQAIKRSFIDPNKNLSSWNHGDPCKLNWTGVECFNTTLTDGYLHIKELLLLNMNLSGSLSPELGRLSHMKILDVMWNKISGSIPKEIGNMTSLELLLLNGNQLTGALPEEIGNLRNLDRIQIDENQISGTLPKSLANLKKIKHLHMNNNSISGQIPPELSLLPDLVHLLLDNNNLSGYLPPELAKLPRLLILQLDNNHFEGATIPAAYSNMSHLLKLSLRNCSLQGPLPELNWIPDLAYIDLSSNQLSGPIPQFKLSVNITTIDVSNNKLTGPIPGFPGQPRLQKLALANNSLRGTVSSIIWQNRISNGSERLIVDFRNNMLTNISGSLNLPPNVTVRLEGNPICSNTNLVQFCGSDIEYVSNIEISKKSNVDCPVAACPHPFQYAPASPEPCFCAAPLLIGFRLKSPGFSDFMPYTNDFQVYLTTGLKLKVYQLDVGPVEWDEGPRLRMYLKLFPVYIDNSSFIFNKSEVARIRWMFTAWKIRDSRVFGPHELLNFTLWGPYEDVIPSFPRSGITKAALAGTVAGTIAGAVMLSAVVSLLILRSRTRKHQKSSHKRLSTKISMKIDGLRSFDYRELTRATNNFDASTQIGQGGYGKVYKGVLADGMIVAVKRAEEGSLQGRREFFTEIELLSRLHHRNLITLTGYCDEAGEQVLVYEYVPNGTLRDHLTGKSKGPLSFAMRLRIALGSAKGILYLHTEADPPIFHRDIKATNILLDSHFTVKVADFGLSRLAPVPDIEGTIPAHISTVVRGTPGYLDPEYFRTHQLTDKSDVYSLGVVFLELLTGMHPISLGKNIVREVNNAYKSGVIFSVIDEKMGSYPSECVEKFVSLALRCCLDEPEARPSMAEVVRELEIIWKMMPESDTRTIDSSNGGGTDTSPPSSSSSMNNHPYVSADVSGSDLVSGVVPLIKPR